MAVDFDEWAQTFPARLMEVANGRSLIKKGADLMVSKLRAMAPRITGRLARAFKVTIVGDEAQISGARYARHVDEGGTVRSRNPRGMIVPVGNYGLRGSTVTRRADLITIWMKGRGALKALIKERRTSRLIAVRRTFVRNRAHPYLDKAVEAWSRSAPPELAAVMAIEVGDE